MVDDLLVAGVEEIVEIALGVLVMLLLIPSVVAELLFVLEGVSGRVSAVKAGEAETASRIQSLSLVTRA